MTSRDFIRKQFDNSDGKEKFLSSIMKDGDGNIYSYGRHYPLLFKLEGLTFVNTRGYSATTGRHIAWAKQAADYQAISVKLKRDDYLRTLTLATVELRLVEQYDAIKSQMDGKKRIGWHGAVTQVYQRLEYDLARVNDSINLVRGATI